MYHYAFNWCDKLGYVFAFRPYYQRLSGWMMPYSGSYRFSGFHVCGGIFELNASISRKRYEIPPKLVAYALSIDTLDDFELL